ncbi:hypothetical protein KC887_00440 [Candidatus Kaiserbacteria bacterium]|nr:hypothetical protein [Candidatus Kaiserbacteria bacterium]
MAKKKVKYRVSTGSVSVGDHTASISAKVSRELLDIESAEEYFCGRILSVKIVSLAEGESEGQKTLPGVDRKEFEAMANVSSFRCTPKFVSFGLQFALSEVHADVLCMFAKCDCILEILKVEANEEASEEDEGSDEEE